jgi:epoxyqueuosine reductase
MDRLTKRLLNKAIEMGFDVIGITEPKEARTYRHFERWLEMGFEGEMAYMSRTKELRRNPKTLMSDCRSIVVVGVGYAVAIDELREEGDQQVLRGKVSVYACRRDYHDVIREKLSGLGRWLTEQVRGAKFRACVDTSPILERELAVSSGVGWFGKNTNVINERFGSYFFIGELLTDVELEQSDGLWEKHCSDCDRCINSCPTGALVSPMMLDARLCISYLTIEHRGAIPMQLRPLIGEWVFGCDICQQVCPCNSNVSANGAMKELAIRRDLVAPNLLEWVMLTEDEFNKLFFGTPIFRVGRERLLRNVAIALGNVGDERAIEPLATLLKNEKSSLIRSHVVWALGRIGGKKAHDALKLHWKREHDKTVKAEIEQALEDR